MSSMHESIYDSVVNNPFFVVMDGSSRSFLGCFKNFKYYDELIKNLYDDETIKDIFDLGEETKLTSEHVKELFDMGGIYIVPYYGIDLNKTIYISLTGNYRFELISNNEPINEPDVLLICSPNDTWLTK
jgi:hypothetical protein